MIKTEGECVREDDVIVRKQGRRDLVWSLLVAQLEALFYLSNEQWWEEKKTEIGECIYLQM